MNQITWGEQMFDSFIRHTIEKAEELSGLEFYLGAFHTEETLNLEEDVTYFIPIENEFAAGFFYLGLSKEDLNTFAEHTLFRLSLKGNKLVQPVPAEQIVVEFARDLYEIPHVENGTFEKIENFFAERAVETNFMKFDGEVKRECLYFEIMNEEFGVTIKCKCMFYEKE